MDRSIADIWEQVRAIGEQGDGLVAARSTPALTAGTLPEASHLAERYQRPVFVLAGGRPVTVFPRGMKPAPTVGGAVGCRGGAL